MRNRQAESPLSAIPCAWSWTRLGWVVTAILAIHVVLLFLFSQRSTPMTLQQIQGQHPVPLVWGSPRASAPTGVLLPDPVVFARVVSDGFSGALWLSDARADAGQFAAIPTVFRQPVRGEPNLRPQMDIRLSVSGTQDQRANIPARVIPVPKPRAPVAEPASPGRSVLRRGEGLSGWQPVQDAPLPVWTNAQLLAPTVVQVLVDALGGVLSTTLELGSGLAEADREALKLARQLRFIPSSEQQLRNGSPLWARLEFVWHTVLPVPGAPPTTP